MSLLQNTSTAITKDNLAESILLAENIRKSIPDKQLDRNNPATLRVIQDQLRSELNGGLSQKSPGELKKLFDAVVNEVVGFGPLDVLLQDNSVTEIMVNGPNQVFVERGGKVVESEVKFLDNDHVERVIQKIVAPLGRTINRNYPMVDARLPDGSRVNAVIPPCAIDGPAITIRKFQKEKMTVDDLVKNGTMSQDMADFLEACVVAKLNIVIAGGSSSGKTTLLNVLSSYIPVDERIVTLEESAELSLHQDNVIRAETKKPSDSNDSEVTIRDLVKNALRMRPDRIIIGECRGGEALDMLQAMNTGHEGSMTTIHANNPRALVMRMETLVLMSEIELPLDVIRNQISSSIDLIVQQSKMRDGTRKITQITELMGIDGETVTTNDIFKFVESGEFDGKLSGRFEPGGYRPKFDDRLKIHGFDFPLSMFTPQGGSKIKVRENMPKKSRFSRR